MNKIIYEVLKTDRNGRFHICYSSVEKRGRNHYDFYPFVYSLLKFIAMVFDFMAQHLLCKTELNVFVFQY